AAASLKPDEPDVFYRLGIIASAKGESENALGFWHGAVKFKEPNPEAYFRFAEELVKTSRNERPVPFYEKAVGQDSGNILYRVHLGISQVRAGHYLEARSAFADAVKLSPNDGSLYYLLGYAARAEGQFDLAKTAFQRSLELQPDNAVT